MGSFFCLNNLPPSTDAADKKSFLIFAILNRSFVVAFLSNKGSLLELQFDNIVVER
ncbi:hypothetical protein BI355_1584 [Companilactobacillus crustorum]|nr:hypothetical protein BI355_1584 [Companilactobacillus crustorum]